jgi:hypothetical protein
MKLVTAETPDPLFVKHMCTECAEYTHHERCGGCIPPDPDLDALLAAVDAVIATLVLVPPNAGRIGFLVAPGQGRAFEIAAADLIAARRDALAAFEEPV